MTFKKSYVPGILGSVLTLTVIMAAPVKAETKEETILNKTDWSTMAAANVEGYANIRSEASVDSEIVGVLMPGYAVAVTEKGNEWSKISSNGVEGYIKNEYLVFGEEAKAHYRNMCGIIGVVQADSLRVREAASTDSAQVGTLTQNGEVSVFGEEADWYQIQYSGSSAYVHGDYVTLSEELKGAVSMEEYQASQACVASSAAAASTAGSASVISADSNDVAMLAALIECEAGGESYTGMVAVGAVVVNRVNSGSFPNSVSGVIYQGGQFTPVATGTFQSVLSRGARSDCYAAAQAALAAQAQLPLLLHLPCTAHRPSQAPRAGTHSASHAAPLSVCRAGAVPHLRQILRPYLPRQATGTERAHSRIFLSADFGLRQRSIQTRKISRLQTPA